MIHRAVTEGEARTIETNGGLRRAAIGAKLIEADRRHIIAHVRHILGVPRAHLTTLLRSYRLVSAYLYRMQDRVTIAEDAWDRARPSDMSESELFDRSSVDRLESARDTAIGFILEITHCEPLQTRAIEAIIEAVQSAVDDCLRGDNAGAALLVSR